MSLDEMPSPERLLALKREREARGPQTKIDRSPTREAIDCGAPEVSVHPPMRPIEWAGTPAPARAAERLRPIVSAHPRTVSLRIPWSGLMSDNGKWAAVARFVGGTWVGRLLLTSEYRRKRDAIKRLAVDAMLGREMFAQPLALEARVWVPDNHRRDVVNFSKALLDALSKVVYADDHWLHRVTWERAGVDVDAPRCELTITPYLPSGG